MIVKYAPDASSTVLARIPDGSSYRPDPKSRTAEEIAQRLSWSQIHRLWQMLLKGLQYRMVGPNRGGRVTTVTGVPSQPRTFYMGVASGGVFRTTNGGTSWENVTPRVIAKLPEPPSASPEKIPYAELAARPGLAVMLAAASGTAGAVCGLSRGWRGLGKLWRRPARAAADLKPRRKRAVGQGRPGHVARAGTHARASAQAQAGGASCACCGPW